MTITHYTGKDGLRYPAWALEFEVIPEGAWPLMAKFAPLPPAPPFDMSKVHVVPVNAWRDTAAYGEKFTTKMIVLDATVRAMPMPTPYKAPQVPGYKLIIQGDPYFFEPMCPCCGYELSPLSARDWSASYICRGCGCLTELFEGDKNGGAGQFDHFDTFKPIGKP